MNKNFSHQQLLIIVFACLLPAIVLVAHGQDIDLKVEANRNQIYLGESFILQIKVSGMRRPPKPDLSQIKNSQIRSLGSQDISNYSITIINGRMVKRGYTGRVINYEITPLNAGTFQAGPVTLDVKGRTLTAPGPVISVTDIEKQDMVKIMIDSSRKTVLVNEPFDITMTILIQRLKEKFADIEPLFPNDPPNINVPYLSGKRIPGLLHPDINRILNERLISSRKQPGININNLTLQTGPFDFGSLSGLDGFFGKPRKAKFLLSPGTVIRNGKAYFKYSLTLKFTPQEEGNYLFGPAVFKGNIPAEVNERGQARGCHIFAIGPACTVRVIPPPEKGRPISYSGAIGTDLKVKASLDTQFCNVGDPFRLTLDISGPIRFNNMLPPKLGLQTNLLQRFTIYGQTVETVKKDHSRQYIYTLRPNKPGAYDLPPIDISYYNTKDRKYKTVETDPIPLNIKQGSEITASQIIGTTNRRQYKKKETDIAETKPAPILIGAVPGSEPGSLIGNTTTLIVVTGSGPLLFIVAVIGQFIRQHNESWKKASQKQKAESLARSRLRSAQSVARNDEARARSKIRDAIRQYMEDKFQHSIEGFTPTDARTLLADSGVNADTTETFCSIFEQVFNAGFSKQTQNSNPVDTCKKLRKLLAEIEKELD